MQIGMVGLGRMGMNMARRLLCGSQGVVAYNRTYAKTEALAREGATAARTLAELVQQLAPPRVVWMMLPQGPPTEEHFQELLSLLGSGDVLVDGGNTHYRDDQRRAAQARETGVLYVDAGVSGGIWGLEEGYCLMVGGPEEAFRHLEPALTALAPAEGYLYCGRSGAGHFVKMVHNGIEYAMMEALGEGFELLAASEYAEGLDLQKVAHLWNQGSVIRSWLLELAERAFAEDPRLKKIAGYVEDSGEGRWAVQAATELGVAAPGLAGALFKRFLSRQQEAFSNQVIAALRLQFGGHMVAETGETHHRVCGAGAGRTQPATPETEGVPPASGPGGERRGEASE